ncbi:EamA family transporter RarD [Actinomadura craniellae]|uniref:EamA family transporter RarD n=1 Tax=Actinomadura craniellae TaxID=2231787 RepID=UPI001F41B914|nr:EamA family transporter RarD [Actinomadura craniellae]
MFPLYWPLLKPAQPLEILAHRIMWSLVAVLAILAVRRHWGWLRTLTLKQAGLLALAATVISVNWGTYIYGVNSGHTIETALGYFITPLINVMFGVLLFRERMRPAQWTAIGLGALAVVVLTADYGRPPWIALTLAASFGTYSLVKKYVSMPSAESLTVETTVLFVPALIFAISLQAGGTASFGHHGAGHVLLLAAAGVITAVPLMLFNAAAIRIPMSTMGMLQYLAPVLQFLIGLLVLREPMPASRWIGFVLVWAALLVFTTDGLRTARRNRLRLPVLPVPAQPVRETT